MPDETEHPRYLAERLRQRLAEETRQLGVEVALGEAEVVLTGAVSDEVRREEAAALAREAFPGRRVRNELTVPGRGEPRPGERLA